MSRSTKKITSVIFYTAFFLITFKSVWGSSEAFKISNNNDVNFKYDIALVVFQGKFRIKSSFLNLDEKNPEDSEFSLSFDLPHSSAGFSFATRVMLGESVLFAAKYPQIIFRSKEMNFRNGKFEILGDLTVKNITRDLKLIATPIGFKPENFDDKSELHFHIFAEINRHDFGASAFSGLVGSNIVLDSRVTVSRVQN